MFQFFAPFWKVSRDELYDKRDHDFTELSHSSISGRQRGIIHPILVQLSYLIDRQRSSSDSDMSHSSDETKPEAAAQNFGMILTTELLNGMNMMGREWPNFKMQYGYEYYL